MMSAVTLIGWTALITSLFWWFAWIGAKDRAQTDRDRRNEAERWKQREREEQQP